jgi:glutamate racemase
VAQAGVDALLLGCTHYPYLARVIGEVLGPEVTLVSSADETAFAARAELHRLGLLRSEADAVREPAVHRFLSSGDVTWFADLGRRLLGPELRDAEGWRIGTLHHPRSDPMEDHS